MNIQIGNLTLTDKNSPKVSMKNDYYTTSSNMIIGGKKTITINGIVSAVDDGSSTATLVMNELKKIRDTAQTSKCVNINIPGFHDGKGRIQNINIDQGSDPSWVNIGAFSIIIEAKLDSIPQNNIGIVASDNVKSLSFSEKIDLGEDSHGFVYTTDNALSKAYIKFNCKISVEIDPLCQSINNKEALENIIRKFIKTSPSHKLLKTYQNWKVYAQDRSYEISSSNSASFTCDSILLSPSSRSAIAYVDLNFKHNKVYNTREETKTISGNIKGLVDIPWSEIFKIQSLNSVSKLDSAEKAFQTIKTKYNNIKSWDGITYELIEQKCSDNSISCGPLLTKPLTPGCMKPSYVTVSRSRTDGTIDFSFDWINQENDCAKNNSNTITIEYTVDDQKTQPSIVSHTIPTVGTLLQNLMCNTARKISFTSSINLPAGSCPGTKPPCTQIQEPDLNKYILKYFSSRGLTFSDYMLIGHSNTETVRNNTIKKSYISVCLTEIT